MASQCAVFLDRDGVLNETVFNPSTNQYEAPRIPSQFKLYPETIEALKSLQQIFKLFIVSNQPDFALGKNTLENIEAVEDHFEELLKENDIHVSEFYYCHHHPKGTNPEYTKNCECRKPSPFFLKKAATNFKIDLDRSWMIGDRDTDIQCGKSVGCKTILVENSLEKNKQGFEVSTFKVKTILEAAQLILKDKGALH